MPLAASVMVVMRPHERAQLVEPLEDLEVQPLLLAGDCHRARQMLEAGPPVHAVLVGLALPDGTWSTILDFVAEKRLEAVVVVCAESVDAALRRQILERADGLLLEPYAVRELQRILRDAAAHLRLAPATRARAASAG